MRCYCLDCASADHEGAVTALCAGLRAHPQDKPGYLIHTSGTGILTFSDVDRKTFGELSSKVYNDWEGIGEVTSLPDHAPHRKVDKIVLDMGTRDPSELRTAIVCPPCIYGPGRGPGNQRSVQIPDLVKCTVEKKVGIQVGEGNARWCNVHVHDLSDCYLKLVEAAVDGGGKATWGKEGYYFTENGEHPWGDTAKTIASAAHKQGLIPSADVVTLSGDEVNQIRPAGYILWGANSRCRAVRARNLLGWSPKGKSINEEMSEAIGMEAKALGLVPGHASKVSG